MILKTLACYKGQPQLLLIEIGKIKSEILNMKKKIDNLYRHNIHYEKGLDNIVEVFKERVNLYEKSVHENVTQRYLCELKSNVEQIGKQGEFLKSKISINLDKISCYKQEIKDLMHKYRQEKDKYIILTNKSQ